MTARTQELIDEVLRLPTEEREAFVELLLDAIESEDFALTADQEEEIARRVEDVREGRNVGRDLDEVVAELEARAQPRRTA